MSQQYPPYGQQPGYPSQPGFAAPSQPLQPGYASPMSPMPPQQPMYMQQAPMPPVKKPRRIGWYIALVVFFFAGLFMGMAIGSGSHATTTTTTTQSGGGTSTLPTAAPVTNSAAHHKLNEAVSIDSTWQVTVTSAKSDPGDGQFNVPKAGNVFVLINVSLKNISSDQQNASGLAQFSLRDADGNKYDESLTYSKDPGGKVASGDPLKGTLAYEVPAATKTFVLDFQSNFTSTDQASWDIHL